jgi:hypothetical protein
MVYVSVLLIQQLAYDKNTVYWLTAGVMALGALSTPLFGAWGDRVGRRALMIGAAAGTIVLFIPLFSVLTTATNLILAGVVFVGLVVLGQAFSPGYTVFVESFPTRIRYTASAFGFQHRHRDRRVRAGDQRPTLRPLGCKARGAPLSDLLPATRLARTPSPAPSAAPSSAISCHE